MIKFNHDHKTRMNKHGWDGTLEDAEANLLGDNIDRSILRENFKQTSELIFGF